MRAQAPPTAVTACTAPRAPPPRDYRAGTAREALGRTLGIRGRPRHAGSRPTGAGESAGGGLAGRGRLQCALACGEGFGAAGMQIGTSGRPRGVPLLRWELEWGLRGCKTARGADACSGPDRLVALSGVVCLRLFLPGMLTSSYGLRLLSFSLTKTAKKGLELKQNLIEELRKWVDTYKYLFIFSVANMRNSKLKDIRNAWKHSRMFFGKNKVMMVALGRSPSDEYKDNLHQVSKRLRGEVGLLFTNRTKEEVNEWFTKYTEMDYARAGNTAAFPVSLDPGPLEQFPHSMEPQLRQLGLPTALKRGVVTLLSDYEVCKEGDVLTPEQARILKLFGYEMAEFKVTVKYMWDSQSGSFQQMGDDFPESASESAEESDSEDDD
ncbi:mRNA turnover protein 4 homolog [Nomascus leucogenys]|uniref:mRNA turnover protein 4 homolog n=1 Tax=Nomascus leucogenys TaxID=61853 RepID=UPI00122D6627|nr:mRNA turnover protein 4 homolog [Nomascus leucogenys]